MLTRVRIMTPSIGVDEQMLNLPLYEDTEFRLQWVDGLGPTRHNVEISDYAKMPGGVLLGGHTESRNIVITMGLHPDSASGKSYTDLRDRAYRTLSPGTRVVVYLDYSDRDTRMIEGTIETLDPLIFSQDTSLQVSIVCESAYFQTDTVKVATARIQSDWPSKLTVHHDGPSPVGMEIKLTVKSRSLDYLYLVMTDEANVDRHIWLTATSLVFTLNGSFDINTKVGSKSILFNSENVIGYLQPSSTWLQLSPGDNDFTVRFPPVLSPNADDQEFDIEVTHRPTFSGG